MDALVRHLVNEYEVVLVGKVRIVRLVEVLVVQVGHPRQLCARNRVHLLLLPHTVPEFLPFLGRPELRFPLLVILSFHYETNIINFRTIVTKNLHFSENSEENLRNTKNSLQNRAICYIWNNK